MAGRPSAEARVAEFLAARYGGRAGPPQPLAAGEWSRAFAFTLDGRGAVARFGAHGEDFAKDRAMAAHRSPDLPIPQVWEVGETPWGESYAVSERAEGVVLDGLDGAGLRRVLPRLLAALRAMGRIAVPAGAGFGGWGPGGTAPSRHWRQALWDAADDRRLPGWRAALAGSPTGAGPHDAALGRLRALGADLPDVRQVVHCDLLHDNVLVRGAEVTAVLDWGNSLYGDALYDAAWLLYWWPWYPAWAEIDIGAELRRHWAAEGGLPPDGERRLLCYQLHIGASHMAYSAFTGRWDDLARNAAQTLALLARA